jgi:hypothetical protein
MTVRTAPPMALAAALALSACVVETPAQATSGSDQANAAPAQAAMRDAPPVAEQALVNQNNSDTSAYVVSSEFSQANSLVMLRDGRGATNWRASSRTTAWWPS